MQLPDESIAYQYQGLLVPTMDEWGPEAEMRWKHFLQPARLRAMVPQMMQVRSQLAAERELKEVPPEQQPLDAGFIDLPQQLLDTHRRKGDASDLGRIVSVATRLKAQVDHVAVRGMDGSYLRAPPLFEALRSHYHNEHSPE